MLGRAHRGAEPALAAATKQGGTKPMRMTACFVEGVVPPPKATMQEDGHDAHKEIP